MKQKSTSTFTISNLCRNNDSESKMHATFFCCCFLVGKTAIAQQSIRLLYYFKAAGTA